MNQLRQTNTFSGGMNMDLDYSLLKDNQYQYAENIRITSNDSNSFGTLQNIEGLLKTIPSINLSPGAIIHVDTIRDWAIIFALIPATTTFDIYRFDFTNSDTEPKVTKIVSNKDLNIAPNESGAYTISSVCRWESDNNVKIYWCDGNSQIRILNVDPSHDIFNQNITADSITILPKSVLPPLEFVGMGTGSLLAGKVQYCYQLFNPRSSETTLSILSKIIHLTKTDDRIDSQDVIGSAKKENTGKSVILQTTFPNSNFTRAKIIALYYYDNNTIPTITIIDDVSVTGNTLHYEDKGGSAVSEISIDEFNSLTSYPFFPKVLESKDNILFAANITEDTWDISDQEYDTRSYRCNEQGTIYLSSNSGQQGLSINIGDLATSDVSFNHDCICPFNFDENSNYKYRYLSDGQVALGGQGKNIDYSFVVTDLIEDDDVSDGRRFTENFSCSTNAVSTTSSVMYTVDPEGTKIQDGIISFKDSTKILNYSDPEVDALLRGYQRDEIYRFGIVLYNDANIPSSTHWIADIRMPKVYELGYAHFTSGKVVVLSGSSTPSLTVVTHPLGVKFTVRNLPQGITGYEIVRCERTISDRSILAQGIVSSITNYGKTSNSLFPLPYLTYSDNHGYKSDGTRDGDKAVSYIFDMAPYSSTEYFMFISPDICINRENSAEIIDRFTSVQALYKLISEFVPSVSPQDYTKVLANAGSIKANGVDIVSTADLIFQKSNGYVGTRDNLRYIYIGSDDFYSATLAKYYSRATLGGGQSAITTAKLAVNTDPFDAANDAWKTKSTSIGNKVYYNWVNDHAETSTNEDANNVRKNGPHGICAIFHSPSMLTNIPLIVNQSGILGYNSTNSVKLCNMRQNVNPYGGSSYAVRQNSVYISTGTYQKIDSNNTYINYCFGGDTYIGVLDYANAGFMYVADDYNTWSNNRLYNGAFFPCESSVNLSLRSDKTSVSKTNVPASGYSNHFVENDIIQVGSIYSQSEPLYTYNDAYSAQPKAKKFVSKSIYNIDNLNSDSRVMHSLPKTNNEVTDSWTKFKVANYLDVDNRFGSINNMALFKNNLIFWQTDAFGTLSVNERSLITDNNAGALTLGTGGILTRFEYFTTKNGSRAYSLRNNTQSDSTVYWYDADRNEICGFDNSLQTVSKIKGVQSYLEDSKVIFIDHIAVYDKKYNEVLFTLGNNTLVFNEQIGAFTSFYTINPRWWLEFSDKLYHFKEDSLYKYNSGDTLGLYDDKSKMSYIRFVINKDYPQTKTFDNVEYGGDFKYPTNFNIIYFNTKRQTSETLTSSDIDYREDTYKFSIPRNSLVLNEIEQLANKSYKDRMKGKYLVCHYKYDCNKGNTFKVPYISTAYRYSMI